MGALRSRVVNLTALARRIEAAHFPDLAATRDVVPETTGKSLSVPLTCVEHNNSVTAPAVDLDDDGDEVKSKPTVSSKLSG